MTRETDIRLWNRARRHTQQGAQLGRRATDRVWPGSLGATMDHETNNPNTPNNVKPFKPQNETLKTELESLRKVINPYPFVMINNITVYL